MIVQTAPEGEAHFVVLQADHARASGQLALAFGNADFGELYPKDLMEFVVAHHDEGWTPVDAEVNRDERTGLPYHLTQTPLPDLVRTGNLTPDFNEARHPFCGVISSMHFYGLYHGRYGLSDKLFIDTLTDEHKPLVDDLLSGELARQQRLKKQLRADGHGDWAQDDFLFHNYKLLQFFDTLSLYFHMVHAKARAEATFQNLPRGLGDDVTVTVRPVSKNAYGISPWPFGEEALEFTTAGRYLKPQPASVDLADVFHAKRLETQTVTLLPGRG